MHAFVLLSPAVCVGNVFVPVHEFDDDKSAVFLAVISVFTYAVVATLVLLSPAVCVVAVFVPVHEFVVNKSRSIKD